MKTYEISYIKGLGSFLDDEKIEWASKPEDMIEMQFYNDCAFAIAMIKFGEHKTEYQS